MWIEEEVRVLGYCEECGRRITDNDDVYIDKEGHYFDSVDCIMEYYEIEKLDI